MSFTDDIHIFKPDFPAHEKEGRRKTNGESACGETLWRETDSEAVNALGDRIEIVGHVHNLKATCRKCIRVEKARKK